MPKVCIIWLTKKIPFPRCPEQIQYMKPMHSGRIKCATRSDRSLDWGIYSPGSLPKKYFLRSDRSPNQGIYYPGSPPRKYFLMRLENPALLKRIKYLKTVTFGKYLWTYVNNDVWVSWGTTIGNIVLRNLIKKTAWDSPHHPILLFLMFLFLDRFLMNYIICVRLIKLFFSTLCERAVFVIEEIINMIHENEDAYIEEGWFWWHWCWQVISS